MMNTPLTCSKLVDECVRFYSASRDANGLPVWGLTRDSYTFEEIKKIVIESVKNDEIEVVFAETDENPHIRRFPREMRKPFDQLVDTCDLSRACLYPTERIIAGRIDLTRFSDSPYTLKLWQGKAHLQYIFFDLKILMTYHSDPRYALNFGSIGGDLYTRDASLPDSEKFGIQDMSVGYSESGERVLGVILRYLCDLSPAHQRIWAEHERKDKCKVNELSLDACYFGQWYSAMSIYDALTEELRVINEISEKAFSKKLFRSDFSDSKPEYYHVLLISTEREYRNFASALDAILSENLNKDFFLSSPEIANKIKNDNLGSIGSLKLWLKTFWKSNQGNPVLDISKGFDLVRKERSIGAHPRNQNIYDIAYTEKQRYLIGQAYNSIRILRLLLQNLPKSKLVDIPDWLNDKIVNP